MNQRLLAIQRGDILYYSGKPCGKGHHSGRYASNGMCAECLRGQRAIMASVARKTSDSSMRKLTLAVRPDHMDLMRAVAAKAETDPTFATWLWMMTQ